MKRYWLSIVALSILFTGCDTAGTAGGSGARDEPQSKQADDAKIKKAEKELNKKGP